MIPIQLDADKLRRGLAKAARTVRSLRNSSCRCGSGRKYKRCCLPKRRRLYNVRLKRALSSKP